jgi:hypothetical protein
VAYFPVGYVTIRKITALRHLFYFTLFVTFSNMVWITNLIVRILTLEKVTYEERKIKVTKSEAQKLARSGETIINL